MAMLNYDYFILITQRWICGERAADVFGTNDSDVSAFVTQPVWLNGLFTAPRFMQGRSGNVHKWLLKLARNCWLTAMAAAAVSVQWKMWATAASVGLKQRRYKGGRRGRRYLTPSHHPYFSDICMTMQTTQPHGNREYGSKWINAHKWLAGNTKPSWLEFILFCGFLQRELDAVETVNHALISLHYFHPFTAVILSLWKHKANRDWIDSAWNTASAYVIKAIKTDTSPW